jgi:hypothetical protein
MTEIEKKAKLNTIDKENTELYNKKMNKGFANKISSLRGSVKKYKFREETAGYSKVEVGE